jgi:hypothetical protein
MDGLATVCPMLFCTGSFVAHSARSRGFVERFSLARGCATARKRGFILPTAAFNRFSYSTVWLPGKDVLRRLILSVVRQRLVRRMTNQPPLFP